MRRHFFALLVSVFCGDILSSSCGICTRWKSDGFCHTTYARMFCMETCHRCKRGRVTDSYFSSSWDQLIALNIVIIRNWLGNSACKLQMNKQRSKDLCWKVHDPAQSFVLQSHPLAELRNRHVSVLLVSSSGTNHDLLCLCRVIAKKANKNIYRTKNFVKLPNHLPLFTMLLRKKLRSL